MKNKETIDLRIFDVGLYSNPDKEDIPAEAQVEGSKNIDPNLSGKLGGIYESSVQETTSGLNGTKHGWIERNGGEWDLVFSNGTGTKIVTDFYGTSGSSSPSSLSALSAEVITPNNQEVHLGMGKDSTSKWMGYISHNQFNSASPTKTPTLTVTGAQCDQPDSTNTVTVYATHAAATEEEAVFPKGVKRHYRISFTYDGYQDSPIGGTGTEVQITGDYDYIPVLVTIPSASSLNDRITGIRIWVREAPFYDSSMWSALENYSDWVMRNFREGIEPHRFTMGTLGSYGEFKLLKDIDINDEDWGTSGTSRVYTFNDTNDVGGTYYSHTGINHDNTETTNYYGLDYGLGATANNMLFVSSASHPKIPDEEAAHMVFRSKPYRLDTFDWVNDKLILPTIPKAMKSHRGKLYVWDDSKTYIIDPIAFQIENVIEGRGCSSPESVVGTDYGLFWANQNGVFWSELTTNILKPVQDSLSEVIRSQYQTAFASQTPMLSYNSQTGQLLVRGTYSTFAYHLAQKRWDFYFGDAGNNTRTGTFSGKNGETYFFTDNDYANEAIKKDFGSATRASWTFISKEFTLDDPSQEKKFYQIISDISGSVTVQYSVDSGSSWTTVTGDGIITNAGDVRAKSIMLKLIGSSGSTLDSVSIKFRRLRGK